VRTAMSVGPASRLGLAEAVAAGCALAHYSPHEVDLAVTGDASPPTVQVQTMVQRLLGVAQPPRPADASDAAALALCHLAHAPARARIAAASSGARS
ncbi:MAG: crossover junction endodeoxyribonuclease RuvC, partial [Aquihabitans sp.]